MQYHVVYKVAYEVINTSTKLQNVLLLYTQWIYQNVFVFQINLYKYVPCWTKLHVILYVWLHFPFGNNANNKYIQIFAKVIKFETAIALCKLSVSLTFSHPI